jgi:hypothetical protein
MSELEEGRCKHGEIADWCGESECMAARKGLPVRVWRTAQGQVYHRKPTCAALRDGQRMAQKFGKQASTLVNYRSEAGRKVALKDQRELRPDVRHGL